MIHEANLGGFYGRLKKWEATMEPPPDAPVDMDQYDLQEVQEGFVCRLHDGTCQAHLMVEGRLREQNRHLLFCMGFVAFGR